MLRACKRRAVIPQCTHLVDYFIQRDFVKEQVGVRASCSRTGGYAVAVEPTTSIHIHNTLTKKTQQNPEIESMSKSLWSVLQRQKKLLVSKHLDFLRTVFNETDA